MEAKTFTLQDIRTGMLVQQRDGQYMIVFLDTSFGDVIRGVDDRTDWMYLADIEDNFKSRDSRELDIVKVLEPRVVLNLFSVTKEDYDLVWEEDVVGEDKVEEEDNTDMVKLLNELESEVERMVELLSINKKKYTN